VRMVGRKSKTESQHGRDLRAPCQGNQGNLVPPNPKKRAFVTFLIFNDSYLPGCLMAAYGLSRQASPSDRVCVVTPDISKRARAALSVLYDHVIEVENTPLPRTENDLLKGSPRTGSARVLDAALTRFACLRLGSDGDLGSSYEKIVMIDADLLPIRDFESLWRLRGPAGVINESREHMVEIGEGGNLVVRPESLKSGKWVWHDIYGETCPHGSSIPESLTNRVMVQHDNYGVNASLLVIEPSMSTYADFMHWISTPDISDLATQRWRWTDQQAATLYWSGKWTSVDPSFSTLYGYPSIELARGLHFAGVKPWSWRKKGFTRRLLRFPDYQLWGEVFVEMLTTFPELAEYSGLRRIRVETESALRLRE
jgi:hypothetical protein